MKRLKVTVLMGGKSAEREVSLSSGKMVLEALRSRGHDAYPIEITTEGLWLNPELARQSPLSCATSLAAAIEQGTDIVFIALHGPMGEDGTVQGLLEIMGIPYTGSGVLASALGMDKKRSRILFAAQGLRVPPFFAIEHDSRANVTPMVEQLGLPVVIKPNNYGSSLGVSIVRQENDLNEALERAFSYSEQILIEKYLRGTEITVPLLGNHKAQALPVVEIVPPGQFFDYQAKYDGSTQEICPARIESSLFKEAQSIALAAFSILGCRGFARADMIIAGREIYLLEMNTIPGLTYQSLVPKAARVMGMEFPDFIERILQLGLEAWEKRGPI